MKLKRSSNNLVKLVLALSFLLSGCVVAEQKPFERNETEQYIADVFENDFGIDIVTKSVDTTLFIYVPTTKRILRLDKAMGMAPGNPDQATLGFIHIDSEYQEGVFSIDYATAELPSAKQFIKNITYNYTMLTNEIMNKIYYMIYDALSDRPGHYKFFKVIMADVQNGIEMSLTFNEMDLRKAIAGAIPFFEFNKRVITEMDGGTKIVNDLNGRHVDFSAIQMPNFMSDLSIQYIRSAQGLNSQSEVENFVLQKFYDITRMYDYTEFLYVRITDMMDKQETLASYDELVDKFNSKS